MNTSRTKQGHTFSLKAVVGVIVGSILPCDDPQRSKKLAKEFDDLLFYLSDEEVTRDQCEAPEHRRRLRNRHLGELKELFPELAKACDNVDSYDPAWLSMLTDKFGKRLNMLNAALETSTNPPNADDYLAPLVVQGGEA